MKLSELKFDGTDEYKDKNIKIFSYYILITDSMCKKLNITLFSYSENEIIVYTSLANSKNYEHYYCLLNRKQIFNTKIEFIKYIVKLYQNYLRKEKLNEIIGA